MRAALIIAVLVAIAATAFGQQDELMSPNPFGPGQPSASGNTAPGGGTGMAPPPPPGSPPSVPYRGIVPPTSPTERSAARPQSSSEQRGGAPRRGGRGTVDKETVDRLARELIGSMQKSQSLNGQFANQLEVVALLRSWGFTTQDETIKAVMAELARLGYAPAQPATYTSAEPTERGSKMNPWMIAFYCLLTGVLAVAAWFGGRALLAEVAGMRDPNHGQTIAVNPQEDGKWILWDSTTRGRHERLHTPVAVVELREQSRQAIAAERIHAARLRQAELDVAKAEALARAAEAHARAAAASAPPAPSITFAPVITVSKAKRKKPAAEPATGS